MNNRPKLIRLMTLFTLTILYVGGCKDVQVGLPLKSKSFEMPVGIAVHPKGYALVLSSNFDVKRKGGSLRVIDLEQLAQRIDNPPSSSDKNFDMHKEVILDEASISVGSFAGAIDLAASDEGGVAVVTLRDTNELLLVDFEINEQAGQSNVDLRCWPDGDPTENESFPKCSGERHLLDLENVAPFDVLLWSDGAESDPNHDMKAFVSFLSSNVISVVQIPSDDKQPPSIAHVYDEYVLASDQLAYASQTGFLYATRRSSQQTLFSVQYLDPKEENNLTATQDIVRSGLQNTESRSIDFLEDGITATLLVRNPSMLIFLDISLGSSGMPRNEYIDHIILDGLPIRVKNYRNLSFLTSTEGDTVYIVNNVNRKIMEIREDICVGPYDMDIYETNDRKWLLVTCFEESKIAVLDIDENSDRFLEVIARIGG